MSWRNFHHINTLPKPSSVVIRTADTDILVIAVGCRRWIDAELKIWIEAGIQGNNTLRYISVDQICYDLGDKLCKALPAYHALLGLITQHLLAGKEKYIHLRGWKEISHHRLPSVEAFL